MVCAAPGRCVRHRGWGRGILCDCCTQVVAREWHAVKGCGLWRAQLWLPDLACLDLGRLSPPTQCTTSPAPGK